MHARVALLLLTCTALALGDATVARAQDVASPGRAVLLQLRPKAGDTLRSRLEQQSELTGTRRTASGDATSSVTTTMRMWAHAIVERALASGTRLRNVTDSVSVSTTDPHAKSVSEQAHKMLVDREMVVHVNPDGTMGMADEASESKGDVGDLISTMPASFPKTPVRVGDSWTREMPLPTGGQFLTPVGGMLKASFRLDSLTHGGDLAWVSMKGTLSVPADAASGQKMQGGVTGSMLVDRVRGWLTESHFTILVKTSLVPQGSASTAGMHFQMRITQRLRVQARR
ncbi:MAG: hypothetical protein JWO05_400 [Gemmatimonadetes bacterium]|nr:hypothetical protein [Gemmatimonadota bacterium]